MVGSQHARRLPQIRLLWNCYLVCIAVTIMAPHSFLTLAANETFFILLSPRNSSDMRYVLTQGSQYFFETYAGAYVMLTFINIAFLIIQTANYWADSSYHYVADRRNHYLAMLLIALAFIIGSTYFLIILNDFEPFSSSYSWFKDNSEVHRIWLPQKMDRSAILFVAITYTGLLLGIFGSIQILLSILLGDRVMYADITKVKI